jgi:hypothetical protein
MHLRYHKNAIIAASILVLIGLGFLFLNGTLAKVSANAGRVDLNAPSGIRAPIATYNSCASFIAAYQGANAHVETHCWKDGESIGGMSWSESFMFTAPDAMKTAGTACIQCPNKVIQYGENDFDLVFVEKGMAKTYPVKLLENLP